MFSEPVFALYGPISTCQWGFECGPAGIRVRILNSLGKNITATHFFTVIEAPYVPPPPNPPAIPPYIMFLSIFIPIIAGVVVVLGVIAYKRYKKQDKESRVVKLPLEDRLLNLKLLKESGRLEECLSYLFNSIYMELVNAKFGRTRNENETIRDFAIVSVKDLKLNPTTIYPFIQKVEEIIYARPFQISDKDFYYTVELFSPVYHQLTGYDFSLNF